MNKKDPQNEASMGRTSNQVAAQAIRILVNKRAMIRPIAKINDLVVVVGGMDCVRHDHSLRSTENSLPPGGKNGCIIEHAMMPQDLSAPTKCSQAGISQVVEPGQSKLLMALWEGESNALSTAGKNSYSIPQVVNASL